MYLSRIAINKDLRKSRQALAFPQMMHAAVLASFPPDIVDEGRDKLERVLWRTDHMADRTWLYVLSGKKPDFQHIVEQFGWENAGQAGETKEYSDLLDRLEEGQQWHFRLHANPVRNIEGKILPHVTIDQQKQWLKDRASKNGFSFGLVEIGGEKHDAFDIVYRDRQKFKKAATDKSFVTLSVATFEGTLVVENAEKLRYAMCSGIGRAKAYGCGLLTLAYKK
ncbi:MAG: type I-E CRISPR-associated protein Cas6/Cse3/CasE [Clostridiales bacterium]|nr:type I-E CRISPR-associated protein Cas6/Cse3/CasE [Clostridiales bacterium]